MNIFNIEKFIKNAMIIKKLFFILILFIPILSVSQSLEDENTEQNNEYYRGYFTDRVFENYDDFEEVKTIHVTLSSIQTFLNKQCLEFIKVQNNNETFYYMRTWIRPKLFDIDTVSIKLDGKIYNFESIKSEFDSMEVAAVNYYIIDKNFIKTFASAKNIAIRVKGSDEYSVNQYSVIPFNHTKHSPQLKIFLNKIK